MRKTLLFLLLAALTGVAAGGCSSNTTEKPKKPKAAKVKARPAVVITASLKQLLARPRAELAKQCDDLTEELRSKERLRAGDTVSFALNGNIRLALSVPVFQIAKFSKDSGSFPPYLAEGAHDNGLAVHVARHGDVEFALKLVDPADDVAVEAVKLFKTQRNYPVEWTRLVGLMQHSAQFSLACGNVEGAKDLLKLHDQLAEMNDEEFPAALRAALLPRGKSLLKLAADAWEKSQNPELAREIRSHLLKWETVKPPVVCAPGSSRETMCRVFGAEAVGRAVTAAHPLRVLDLLSLPLPSDGLEAATACLDGFDRLEEILITYQSMAPDIESASQFGQAFDDWRRVVADPKAASRCVYPLGETSCELVVVSRNAAVAAVARLISNLDMPDGIELPREFGALHLSGTFERNRASTALHERSNRLVLARSSMLEKIKNPLPVLPLDHVVLARHATEDVLDEVIFEYARPAEAPKTLAKIAQPLFEAFGAPRLSASGKDMLLHWQDQNTRYVLTIPDVPTRPVRLVGADVHHPQIRHQRARAWDLAERKQRLDAAQPLTLLPREFEGIALGMTRQQVEEKIGQRNGVQRKAIAGGEQFLLNEQPEDSAATPRELFVHYKGDVVDAVRARYELSPETSPRYILEPIQSRAGAPLALPAPIAVWPELTRQPAPSLQQWRDDITILACRRADSGLELIASACPPDRPEGTPLPELSYLPRGPERCLLGASKTELLAAWGVREPVMAGAALLLGTPETSPYDALLVWFSADKASRIVGRHRIDSRSLTDAAKASLAMRQEWAKQLAEFGWPWRQDFAGSTVQSWGHHDDRTRVRIFWQDGAQGRQIFSEWMPLPSNAPAPAPKTVEKKAATRKKR